MAATNRVTGDARKWQARTFPILEKHRYPLLFVTLSGAHLYGFPSADSDFDLRGAHLVSLTEFCGLDFDATRRQETQTSEDIGYFHDEMVTHDLHKFTHLLLKGNGYALEQLFSPLIIRTSPTHKRLKDIAERGMSRAYYGHYWNFARDSWREQFDKPHKRLKCILYAFRVCLTGINLLRTGIVQANLPTLLDLYRDWDLGLVRDLLIAKQNGQEVESRLPYDISMESVERVFNRLHQRMGEEHETSPLPDLPDRSIREEFNRLLVQARLQTQ